MRRLFATSITFLFFLTLGTTAWAQQDIDLGLITVKSKAEAEQIRDKIMKGASFESLAKTSSVGPCRLQGRPPGPGSPQEAAHGIPKGPAGLAAQPAKPCHSHGGRLHHPHVFRRPAQVENRPGRKTGACPGGGGPSRKAQPARPALGQGSRYPLSGRAHPGGVRRGAAFPR